MKNDSDSISPRNVRGLVDPREMCQFRGVNRRVPWLVPRTGMTFSSGGVEYFIVGFLPWHGDDNTGVTFCLRETASGKALELSGPKMAELFAESEIV